MEYYIARLLIIISKTKFIAVDRSYLYIVFLIHNFTFYVWVIEEGGNNSITQSFVAYLYNDDLNLYLF